MTLPSIARAYLQSVELEERARMFDSPLCEATAELRGELHALLMEALRQANIPFTDRAQAAQIAHDLIRDVR
jgi:hypothetical protein